MIATTPFISPADGTAIATYGWGDELAARRGVVQIAHGIAEHAQRYIRTARALVDAGYVVGAVDHRGHGRSVSSPDQLGHFDFTALVAESPATARRCERPSPTCRSSSSVTPWARSRRRP